MLKENRNFEYNHEMENEGNMTMPGMECPPLCKPPIERVVNRNICHHVPHIQPIHTRIINHHIYKHSCVPCFTCCEENVVSHVNENHYYR